MTAAMNIAASMGQGGTSGKTQRSFDAAASLDMILRSPHMAAAWFRHAQIPTWLKRQLGLSGAPGLVARM